MSSHTYLELDVGGFTISSVETRENALLSLTIGNNEMPLHPVRQSVIESLLQHGCKVETKRVENGFLIELLPPQDESELAEELRVKNELLETLQKRLDDVYASPNETEEITELKEQLAALQQENETLKALEGDFAVKEAQYGVQKEANSNLISELEAAKTENLDLQKQVSDISEEKDKMINTILDENSALKDQLDELQTLYDTIAHDYKMLSENPEIDEVREELGVYIEENEQLKKKIQAIYRTMHEKGMFDDMTPDQIQYNEDLFLHLNALATALSAEFADLRQVRNARKSTIVKPEIKQAEEKIETTLEELKKFLNEQKPAKKAKAPKVLDTRTTINEGEDLSQYLPPGVLDNPLPPPKAMDRNDPNYHRTILQSPLLYQKDKPQSEEPTAVTLIEPDFDESSEALPLVPALPEDSEVTNIGSAPTLSLAEMIDSVDEEPTQLHEMPDEFKEEK